MDPELYQGDSARKQQLLDQKAKAKLEAQKSQMQAMMYRNPRLRQFLPSEIPVTGVERRVVPKGGDFYHVFHGSRQPFEPQIKLDYTKVMDRKAPMDLPQFYKQVVEEVEVDDGQNKVQGDGIDQDQSVIGDQTLILNGDMISNLHLLGPEAKGKDFKTLNKMYQEFIRKKQAEHEIEKRKERAEREAKMRLKAEQDAKAKPRKIVRTTVQRGQDGQGYTNNIDLGPERARSQPKGVDPTVLKKIDVPWGVNPNHLIVEFLQSNPQHMHSATYTHKFGEDFEAFKQAKLQQARPGRKS